MKQHKTDTELGLDGAEALIRTLGEVDAERYIAGIIRFEPKSVSSYVFRTHIMR